MKKYYQYADDVINGKVIAGKTIKLACKRFLNDLQRDDLVFNESVVDDAIQFIGTLKHFTGRHSGKAFILEPWQEWIVANIIGFYRKDTGRRRFTSSYIEVSRKNGKALSLDTPIPTPTGFKSMGELKIGDFVLDRNGLPTTVTFVTPIQYNRNCFKLTFEDGEEIIADADHQWQIKKKDVDKELVLTTKDLLNFKNLRKDQKGTEYRYRVPVNKPIELPEKELPLDPYILGLWLGDGSTSKPDFTVSSSDLQMYDCLVPFYGEYKLYHKKGSDSFNVSFAGDKGKNNSKLRHKLIEAGVFKSKHIPEIYLRASKEQRLALLQGLMDTDGTVSSAGQCEFVQKSTLIADGFCELLSTLGIKYNRTAKIPRCNGKECDEVQRITFYTDKKLPCFRLQRKFDKLKENLNKRMLYKSIVDIQPIESVPVKCISVDNPESLYLCGKKFTVTHNTALAAALSLYYLIADGEDGAEVLLAANSKEQAKICFNMCSTFAKGLDPKGKHLTTFRADILFNLTKSSLKVLAADDTKLDGFNASFGLLDEYHAAPTSKVKDVIKSSMAMRENPHLSVITTAGFSKSSPCYQFRTVSIEVLNGLKTDDELFIAIYSMDTDDDWKDSKNWIKCTPNLGITVKPDFIYSEVQQASNNPSDEVGVRTKTLNQWCDSATVWLPEDYILKCSKKIDLNDFKGMACYVGVDLAATSDLTALCFLIIDKEGKYHFKLHYYLPESALKEKTDKELYKYWRSQGILTVTSGNVTDYDYITKDIKAASKIVNIQKIYYDSWNSTQWAISSTEQGLPLEPYSQTIGNFNKPTRELERLILANNAVIDNNEITRHCFRNVVLKSDHNGNVKPKKQVEGKKIDGVIAMIMALGGYLTNPRYKNRIITI